ncbi:MAG: hypothetical protein JSV83_00205 [Desulfobacterales bacterium]|nr:MAG: hypothetical protein JSV83_00205 [Desulfobacterales bacterium]
MKVRIETQSNYNNVPRGELPSEKTLIIEITGTGYKISEIEKGVRELLKERIESL